MIPVQLHYNNMKKIDFPNFTDAMAFIKGIKKGKIQGTSWLYAGELTSHDECYILSHSPDQSLSNRSIDQHEDSGELCHDKRAFIYQQNGLEWQVLPDRNIECFGQVKKLVSHYQEDGWRLPTIFELSQLKLLGFKHKTSSFQYEFSADFKGREKSKFWSCHDHKMGIIGDIGSTDYHEQSIRYNDKIEWDSCGNFAGIGKDSYTSRGDILLVRGEKPLTIDWCIELVQWAALLRNSRELNQKVTI
ncbi:hypothetical protein P3480_00005 [Vibrio parahaemolyticus]|nr:hypothetical protein [Vibrio parahaemolyticus]